MLVVLALVLVLVASLLAGAGAGALVSFFLRDDSGILLFRRNKKVNAAQGTKNANTDVDGKRNKGEDAMEDERSEVIERRCYAGTT